MSESQGKYVKSGQAPGASAPRDPKKKKRGMMIFAAIAAVVVLLSIIVIVRFGGSATVSKGHDKAWSSGSDNVAVIHVEGAIGKEGATYNQEWIEREIQNARFDKQNKAIVLLVNSPGGTVYESDATYEKLLDYKKETNRPVYTYAEQLMASGGYYIASASDEIYANRNSMVGSIGVIGGSFVDAQGLMDKIGVKMTLVHSGKNKLMGNPFSPPTEEQLAIMQSMSDEAYEQFVDIVAKARKMDMAKAKTLADGRIYSAKQAKANGLLNDVMRYDAFKDLVREKLKNDKIDFVDKTYQQPRNVLSSLLSSESGVHPLQSLLSWKDPVGQTMESLKKMQQTEPMYLYRGVEAND